MCSINPKFGGSNFIIARKFENEMDSTLKFRRSQQWWRRISLHSEKASPLWKVILAALLVLGRWHILCGTQGSRSPISLPVQRDGIMLRKPGREAFSLMTSEIHAVDPSDSETIDRLFKREFREGEQALMLAILENAIEAFHRYLAARSEKEKKQYQEAEEWILGKDGDWLFSFENICETLGLDPSYLRRAILSSAKRRDQEQIQPPRS